MPQETNLNVSPYFDDFNENKNFNRVLFKPASPVQARELTQLQSILQNQIERFGQHFFKEGAMVIPGQIAYDPLYYAVEINDTFLGIPVSEYLDQLIGKVIRGASSGVEATVVNYLSSLDSEKGNNTLYIKYSKSGTDFATETFQDGENLITNSDIEYGLSRITANNSFASCISANATSIGSSASIQEGVYFIRGFFVKVSSQSIVLDQYSSNPNYRVGLLISENVVTAYDDSSLFDNATGFSNFAAPGADRFQIETTLIKKGLDEFNDENFVELMRLENGTLQKFVKKTDYNVIRDELARRTYDESGDYYVKPFQVAVKESLNNRQGNGGIYFQNQKTAQGGTPSNDLMLYQVSPGKAYVRGFDIEKLNTSYIDVEKPRDVKTVSQTSFVFNNVGTLKVNNVYGSPLVGFGTTAVVSLRNERIGSTASNPSGDEIGNAKVYDYKLEAAAYSNDATKYDIYLYDVQTFTTLTVSSDLTQSTPAFIEGARSGARGFLKNDVTSSKTLTLTSTNGQFIVDEPITINGIQNNVVVTSVREYSFDDVKSVYQNVGINTFNADSGLTNRVSLSTPGTNFTIGATGIVTAPGNRFAVGIKTGDIVTYNRIGNSLPTFNRVNSLSSDGATITIVGLAASVTGVCDGGLTTTEIQTSDFAIVRPQLIGGRNSTLTSKLPDSYISNVDLTNSELQIRRQFALNIANNRGTVLVSETNQFFQPFDEERYNLVYSDGTVESLTSSKVTFNSTFKSVTLVGLSKSSDTNAILVATLKKISVTPQTKNLSRCSKLVVSRSKYEYSGSDGTSFNDGLTYNDVYGTRVQDREISLNVPDGLRVHAVFESSTTSEPTLPNITLVNRSSDLTNSIQGELVIGATSGAVARVVTSTSSNVDIIYKNELRFAIGESVTFQSSGITGQVSSVVVGDKNIVTNFTFDNGQRPEFYDYTRIIRNSDSPEPKKQLTVIFDHFVVDTGSEADLGIVNSFSPDVYQDDLPSLRGEPLSDFIDIRPRVKNYDLSSDTDSPFEYDFRDFSSSGSYVPHILVGDETVTLGYSYYLARIDKIFLSKDGFFELKKGAPAENPVAPEYPAGSFTVATVYNKPYMHNATVESSVVLAKHKRYTMFDISRLETRIRNIEFYTQLSLLETDTANLNIKDATTGLDRFKSGFFVDNFRSHGSHAITHPNFRSSIDKSQGQLRPMHYTHGIDLILGSEQVIGIGTTANPLADLTQVSDLQSNALRRTGDVVTLNYSDSEFIRQRFATRTENVNPFAVINWVGVAQLNPSTDTWLEEKRLDINNLTLEGGYQAFLETFAVDPNTGFAPIDWGSWEESWSSVDISTRELNRELQSTEVLSDGGWTSGFTPGGQTLPRESAGLISRTRRINMQENFLLNTEETIQINTGLTRTGIQLQASERIDTQSVGTRLVSRETIPYVRSRNIEFISNRIKPRTRFYVFFEDQDVTQYATPKLLEISMTQGVFQVGETVVGRMSSSSDGVTPEIVFRVAQQNHKYGSYDSPTIIYDVNPYSDTVGLSSSYSATSAVLNIDTASLQQEVLGAFSGYAAQNMRLVGQTSGAEATVTDIKLVTDEKGALIGSFYIPESTNPTVPQFRTGTLTFRVTSSPVNSLSPVDNPSTAETSFRAEGSLNTLQEDVIGIRNVDIQRETVSDSTVTNQTVTRTVQTQAFEERTVAQNQWYDPLAESFEVVDDNGVFVSSCDIFFQTKDNNIPVTLQIRTMQTGLPTNTILPFGEVVYEPSQVVTSEDGSVATRFVFPSPVYLAGKTEYALVLLSASNNYRVFISRMGEEDFSSANLPESERVIVSQQPYMGSLFKSQNGSTWDPSQLEDLKFTLYKCAFVPGPGTLKLYNPELGVGKFENPRLRPQPLEFHSHEILVGFGSTVITRDFTVGSRLTQVGNQSAEGNLVKSLGSIKINTTATESGGITTNRVGTGLTPSASNFTYTGIALTSITGNGSGAIANIQVASGSIGVVTVTSGGTGYAVGDVLGCTLGETGTGTRFNVGIVSATNSLILDRVQGQFNTTSELMTINAVGVASTLSGSIPTSINDTQTYKDGLHVKVNHRNHGMHARNNRVTISGVVGVTTTTTVSVEYSNTNTADISVGSVGVFASFENIGVSSTNPGYVKINGEILSYTGTNAGTVPPTLTGISRGIDDTIPETHLVGDIVQKYEASGISLRRINKTHSLADVNNFNEITLDDYFIKIDTTSSGIGTVRDGTNDFPILKVSDTEITGGNRVKVTQNIQFESMTPIVEFLTPRDTSLTGRVRTVSGTSANGVEVSFQDQGFEDITLNGINYFTSPRVVSSKINEQTHLTTLPGNKSFTMELVMGTNDQNVSPVIDIDRLAVITTSNRLDQRVTNFADDSRVNERFGDPNAAVYITKRVNLENPATFLQVRFAGFRHFTNDFRVLYRLFRTDTLAQESPYELFPGYLNMIDTTGDGFGDQVIDPKNNDGRSDRFVPSSINVDDFRDYQFTASNLPGFNGFEIKVVMTGTNQAYVPRIRDFRTIAFA